MSFMEIGEKKIVKINGKSYEITYGRVGGCQTCGIGKIRERGDCGSFDTVTDCTMIFKKLFNITLTDCLRSRAYDIKQVDTFKDPIGEITLD